VIKTTFYLALPIRPLKQTKRDENDISVLIGIDLLKTYFFFRLKAHKKMFSFDMRISLLIMLFQLQYLDPENCHALNFKLRSVCVSNGSRTTNYVIQDNFDHS